MNDEVMDGEILTCRLTKDLKSIAGTMTQRQARKLVDLYYRTQRRRIRELQQINGAESCGENHAILDWFNGKDEFLESQVAAALKAYAESTHMGQWAMQVDGIGHVLAAALVAYLDVTKSETAGGIWRFCGLDPTMEWKKGEERPWCGMMKTICWKIGESFVKVSNKPTAFYGQLYKQRKDIEHAKNEAGDYKELAAKMAKDFPKHAQVKTYKDGKLPDGHIHSRAKRWAVKLFLAHWFEEAYRHTFKKEPPKPYAIAILGHAHEIKSPITKAESNNGDE